MKGEKYYPASCGQGKFHCPHCNVYAQQSWANLKAGVFHNDFLWNSVHSFDEILDRDWKVSKCEHCGEKVFWRDDEIVYPRQMVVGLPNGDLLEEIKKDYLEAATIFNDSPRASAALLRLALQKLCKQLGEKGENINEDIGSLVKKGLNPKIQQSLDILRITGNNAIHPGEINVEENPDLVLKLFDLLNFIAEQMITTPKSIQGFYDQLPETTKNQIKRRDSS